VERWVKIKKGEVTIDSAAEESVCPKEWCQEYELVESKGKGMKLVAANGSVIKHYGSRKPKFQPRVGSKKGQTIEMEFQVSDVRKPLQRLGE